ncbi:hypothetical protein KIW84_060686 [Lathyrus oleraceus]|uniref:Uncharacterized protein n=1 Tax=Pisum sativum TaxID=3888 RepID=A0A9D5A357_PEA|nr:hypothetical protein KIW84_060686 [Pisum sativum]
MHHFIFVFFVKLIEVSSLLQQSHSKITFSWNNSSRSLTMYLAAGLLPIKLPTPCIGLSYLSLSINFDDLKEISAALCLLRSSPNLQKLKISARIELHNVPLTTVSVYNWDETFSRPATPIQVRHVTIDGISGFQPELDFIRFLLLYSPVLEKMVVKPIVNVRPELVPELIRFKRVSGEAEVIYEV